MIFRFNISGRYDGEEVYYFNVPFGKDEFEKRLATACEYAFGRCEEDNYYATLVDGFAESGLWEYVVNCETAYIFNVDDERLDEWNGEPVCCKEDYEVCDGALCV